MKPLLIPVFFLLFSASLLTGQGQGEVVIRFENLQEAEGELEVAVFDRQKGFLKNRNAVQVQRIRVEHPNVFVTFSDLPYGNYAVSVYHDRDNDGKMKKNWLGIPKEPVGVTRWRKKKLRKPKFREVAFRLDRARHEESILLLEF